MNKQIILMVKRDNFRKVRGNILRKTIELLYYVLFIHFNESHGNFFIKITYSEDSLITSYIIGNNIFKIYITIKKNV